MVRFSSAFITTKASSAAEFNLFGNGYLGRVEANWDSVWVEDPNHESSGYWRYSRNDYRYYYIKDHLGSIRITIDETGNVVNAQDYYSFGGILRSYITGGLNDERYKFTGKERDTSTTYDYFPRDAPVLLRQ